MKQWSGRPSWLIREPVDVRVVGRPPGEVERVERRPRDVVDEQGGGVEGTEEQCSGEGVGEQDGAVAHAAVKYERLAQE